MSYSLYNFTYTEVQDLGAGQKILSRDFDGARFRATISNDQIVKLVLLDSFETAAPLLRPD